MDGNPPGSGLVQMPPELRNVKPIVDTYVNAKVRQFAAAFARRLNLTLSRDQLELITVETLATIAQQEHLIGNNRSLRLVLRHDCQSTGCGEAGCLLCQFNPSRLCRRNLKNKYLIDDHLRAKCGAPLRVELVDETGACVAEGLPLGVQLEIHVLNGEKYKEICPDNTLLSHQQLKNCIISHHQKALLRRDGMSDDSLRCFLHLERGQAPLSDLQVTTSSEALLAGKAPTFRLLVWAVDALGEPVPNVTYVVSENFVVATKRVKHAIKSDIPSVADHVSKLVHIGKATVDKLLDLRSAAREEGFEIHVPEELNRIERVGQFQQLVELSEMNSDLKNKVRHLLKLSPEKWDEVSQHALAAVVPDFRPRVWWCNALRAGLLFSCKNGAVVMEHPIALVKMGVKNEEDQVVPIHQLDPNLFNSIPKLKQQAIQAWYNPSHPGWAIYWKEGQQDPAVMAALQLGAQQQNVQPNAAPGAPSPPPQQQRNDAMDQPAGAFRVPAGATAVTAARAASASPFASMVQPAGNPGGAAPMDMQPNQTQQAQQHPQQQQQQQQQQPQQADGAAGNKSSARSPFAASTYMANISDAFPQWQTNPVLAQQLAQHPPGTAHAQHDGSSGLVVIQPGMNNQFPSLEMLKTDELPGIERGPSLWGLPSLTDTTRPPDWLAGGLNSGLLQQMLQSPDQHMVAMAQHAMAAQQGKQQGQQAADSAQGGGGSSSRGGAQNGGQPPQGEQRQLSLKFSMSLDLEKAMEGQMIEGQI